MPEPVIDIVMTAFNVAWRLRDTRAAIQAQMTRDIQIIMVDDGSAGTRAVLALRNAGAGLCTADQALERRPGSRVAVGSGLGDAPCR